MITPSIKVRIPKIAIKQPDTRMWKAIGIEVAKRIQKRTLSGQDADRKTFQPYAKQTVAQRVARGRTAKVNLTDTGKMLNSIPRGIRARGNGVKLRLSGLSGLKAWSIQNAKRKRIFFAVNDKDITDITRIIKKWLGKNN